MEKLDNLELFYFDTCPFCIKVLRYLRNNQIQNVTLLNIQKDQSAHHRLLDVGGKSQVPCLFINGTPLYESDDIINYFQNQGA